MIRSKYILLLCFYFYAMGLDAQARRPNIVLIYVDDMGIGDVSYTGGRELPTPNIDQLAKEGKVFTKYYSNAPVCSPSRVAITTGMYPLRWNINTFLSGQQHNQICEQAAYLADEAPSLARTLKASGYKTAHFGKWHMGGGRRIIAPSITQYGFDEYASTWESPDPDPLLTASNWIWSPEDSIKRWERTAYFVDKTLDFLARHAGQPCYINLWPDDIHSPWVADGAALRADKQAYFSFDNLEPVIDLFDQEIGRLMKGLEALGVSEHTLLILTSDNGPAPTFERKRTHGLRGAKNSLYEGGIKMPFIIHWPSTIEASQVDSISVISAVDLFPSLCKIGGAKMPTEYSLDGENVSQLLIGGKTRKRKRKLFWEYGRLNPKYSIPKEPNNRSLPLAVRDGRWKFFVSFDGSKTELYDLQQDPNETQDLSDSQPRLIRKLKRVALQWFEKNDRSEVK